MAGVYRGMFLQSKVRSIVFYGSIGFQVAGELQRFAVFIMVPFIGLAVIALLFQLVVAQGATGRLDQAGIHGNAFVDGEPLLFELTRGLKNSMHHGRVFFRGFF